MTALFAAGFDISPHEWVPASWDPTITGYTGGANCSVQTAVSNNGGAAMKLDGTPSGADTHVAAISDTFYNEMFFHFNVRLDGVCAPGAPGVGMGYHTLLSAYSGAWNPGVVPFWWLLGVINDGTSGIATATTHTTMTHDSANWTTNQWAGYIVTIGSNTATVVSNTQTVLTFTGWSPSDPSTFLYSIVAADGVGANLLRLTTSNGSYGGTGSATYRSLAANTWYSIELRFYCPGGEPTTSIPQDYLIEVKLDGVKIFSMWDSMRTSTSSYKLALVFGNPYVSTIGLPACNAYIDDFFCSIATGSYNAGWPGNGLAIISSYPNGEPGTHMSYAAWGRGDVGTPLYTAIDEQVEVTTGSSEFIKGLSVGNKQAWTMFDPTLSGTIRAVTLNVSTGAFIASTNRDGMKLLIWDSAEVATPEFPNRNFGATQAGLALGKRGQCAAAYDRQPTDGTAWTSSVINTMECGAHFSTKPASSDQQPIIYDFRAYVVTGTEGPATTVDAPPWRRLKTENIRQAVNRAAVF